MRSGTFADEKVVDLINEQFVAVWNNHGRGFEQRGNQVVYGAEETAAYPEGGGGGNLMTYIADSSGSVLFEAAGYWKAQTFLEILTRGLEMTKQNCVEKNGARVKTLQRESETLTRDNPEALKKPVSQSPVRQKIAAINLLTSWYVHSAQVGGQVNIVTALAEADARQRREGLKG